MSNIRTYLDYKPVVANSAYIDECATVIGDVIIGENSSVWPMAVIRGDVNGIRIGKNTSIQDGSVLHVANTLKFEANNHGEIGSLTIGDNTTIGHGVNLHACKIGNNVLVGIGAIILDGSIVEDNCIIAAGTIIPPNKVLSAGYLYMGSPYVQKYQLTQKHLNDILENAEHYSFLAQKFKKQTTQ